MTSKLEKIYTDFLSHPVTAVEKRDAWYAKYVVWRIVN